MSGHILVAGGTRGIGRGIVDSLQADPQRKLTVLARSVGDLQLSGDSTFHPYDFQSTEGELPAIPDTLEGLVYCPGTINLKSFRSLKPDDFLNDWQLNFMGAVRLLRACEKSLKASGQASVVLFSTVAVQQGMAMHASVAAAKGAVEGLVRSLAAEWSPAVRVNAIAPALVETSMTEKFFSREGSHQTLGDKYPLKRTGQVADIASLASYLLSPASGWMTGQVLGVDGGMSRVR